MQIVKVATQLPDGWRASSDSRGVIIDAFGTDGRMLGSITVCEQARGFTLGVCDVRKPGDRKYAGRGWKRLLYSDAVAELQAALGRHAARQQSLGSLP